ncbi:rhomboid family protein (plasmid) [Sinorhizobium fredii NGR234]|uniref:Rhomboid family protein n=1 Tax=Sinorhizobium fredii (strain NBRC 101917 / NGR234) TaxID=394 RepID=C3KMY8_SINFN|nr:rhomboid family intramembrane serine protease [Sinorhizobium fredii]ACP21561.1 rhomboid family protein [Sinorhizobium fredii NGR234]
MLPVRDAIPTRYPPTVVWTLIAANILVFLFQISLPPRAEEVFLFSYGLIPSRYFGELKLSYPPQDLSDYLPFVSNMFLHGGWLHLILNMWTLWVFGPAVEDRVGLARFAMFYLVCGLVASSVHAIANPNSVIPAVGASGAIAGVIGCYARMFPFARLVMIVPILFIPLFFEIPALGFAAIWFLMQVIPGVFSLGQLSDVGGVAWWAHIGGFIAGWILAPVLRRARRTYRKYYPDEGVYGFLPDGRRQEGRGPWG